MELIVKWPLGFVAGRDGGADHRYDRSWRLSRPFTNFIPVVFGFIVNSVANSWSLIISDSWPGLDAVRSCPTSVAVSCEHAARTCQSPVTCAYTVIVITETLPLTFSHTRDKFYICFQLFLHLYWQFTFMFVFFPTACGLYKGGALVNTHVLINMATTVCRSYYHYATYL